MQQPQHRGGRLGHDVGREHRHTQERAAAHPTVEQQGYRDADRELDDQRQHRDDHVVQQRGPEDRVAEHQLVVVQAGEIGQRAVAGPVEQPVVRGDADRQQHEDRRRARAPGPSSTISSTKLPAGPAAAPPRRRRAERRPVLTSAVAPFEFGHYCCAAAWSMAVTMDCGDVVPGLAKKSATAESSAVPTFVGQARSRYSWTKDEDLLAWSTC